MEIIKLTFGYFPYPIELRSGSIVIRTLPNLQETVERINASDLVSRDWFYAPPSTRVFALPKTHQIEHADANDNEHVEFHLWALSFFEGIRLTSAEAGFLDASPITTHKMVDFVLPGRDRAKAIILTAPCIYFGREMANAPFTDQTALHRSS